ncbi:hypothetical protein FHU10_0844 [Serratia fonticola]|uniref:Sugar phosphate isomerase/epimerase n=1 Tax=Serratia fonticola TaxID=47917 RepID=A0A559T1C7_SERFO|nr:hypothetical protein FHU11_4446 [Serratia fonticola]TVZ68412.1 hypothetical protein FHU10_0844 [Serratia fonticola]
MLDIRYSLTRLYRLATDTRQAVELMGAAAECGATFFDITEVSE